MRVERQTIAKILVFVFVANLVVMGAGAWLSYQAAPPIPDTVESESGETVVTDESVREGKKAFQRYGLMNHGSILGNGAYYGVDYTADALDLKVEHMRSYYAEERYGDEYDALDAEERAVVDERVQQDLESGAASDEIRSSEAERYTHEQVRQTYVERYHESDAKRGVPAGMVESEEEAEEFADFALWTAWISHTDRPERRGRATPRGTAGRTPREPAGGRTLPPRSTRWSRPLPRTTRRGRHARGCPRSPAERNRGPRTRSRAAPRRSTRA